MIPLPGATGMQANEARCLQPRFSEVFIETLAETMPKRAVARWRSIETLWNTDARMRLLDEFGDYQQVISMSQPPIDVLGGPEQTPALARIANDGMAEICRAQPDRFPSFLLSLPMNNPDEAVKEVDRAISELGACGAQIHSNVNGRALDDPAFFPGVRTAGAPRQTGIPASRSADVACRLRVRGRIEIRDILGPRLGLRDLGGDGPHRLFRHVRQTAESEDPGPPLGRLYPPCRGPPAALEGRSSQSDEIDYGPLKDKLQRPVTEYFKMFYADTAMFGARAASQCGLEFFGASQSLFASDCPFDAEGGRILIRDTISVVDNLRCTDQEREDMYLNNGRAFLGLG